MRIAVLREREGERRVALVPESCTKLVKAGFTIAVEAGAGAHSGYTDEMYGESGAEIENDAAALVGGADIVVKVNALTNEAERNEIGWLKPDTVVLGSLMPLRNLELTQALAEAGVQSFSTDAIPRTTRAQAMDTLSSMNSISGYKGVLLAASELGKYFPMLSSAAGTVFPAKVFVIGAAVAGLRLSRRPSVSAHRSPPRMFAPRSKSRSRVSAANTSASSWATTPPPAAATRKSSRPKTRRVSAKCWSTRSPRPTS